MSYPPDDVDAMCAQLFTGDDPAGAVTDVRRIVEAAITHQPRSLQKRIGPSELGNPCDRCLAQKLGGIEPPRDVPWLPTIGTAVHEWLEQVIIRHEHTRANLGMPSRYLAEHPVKVGVICGEDIVGSTDLFDIHTGTVIDYKIVGTTTLRKAKLDGASTTYRRQAMLYGKGWQDAGYQVRSVAIWYLPRNALSLREGHIWQADYDRQTARDTLLRADRIALDIHTHGLDVVLDSLPPHTGTEFSCRRATDYTTPTEPQARSSVSEVSAADLLGATR